MRIGITFDLRSDYLNEGFTEEETAEFDRESTISGIESSLIRLGYLPDRIGHLKQLTRRLVRGDRWDLVFNISEGLYGTGRESQIPALLDAYQIPYTFSDPVVLSITLHKALTKRIIRDAGLPTPDFFVVTKEGDIDQVELTYPLFVKPVAEGTGKGISSKSIVYNHDDLVSVCRNTLKKFQAGLLVEEFLPGREFTVGILGTSEKSRVIGTMEIVYQDRTTLGIYSYETKSDYENKVRYVIPEPEMALACETLALNCWNLFGCRDAGRVDIRIDRNGIPNFIEINPLAGLDKIHSDLPILAYHYGYSYEEIIAAIMDSALERIC